MKVLLIEDNPDQASRLRRHILEFWGEETEILGPYDQFSDVVPHSSDRTIEIAFVDIQLYDDLYAGIHIGEMLQQLADIPVLFVSAITNEKVLKMAEKVRFSDFLNKPYDKAGFERASKRVINSARENRSGDVKIAFNPRAKDKLWIKTDRSEYYAVSIENVLCVESMDHYCRIYVSDMEAPLITKAGLKKDIMENGLKQYPQFILLSRGLVINATYIEKVLGNMLYIHGLKLLGNRKLTIPKEKRKVIFSVLGIND